MPVEVPEQALRRHITALNVRFRWMLLPTVIGAASRLFSIIVILLANRLGGGNHHPFAVWDGQWYLRIARDGYHAQALGVHRTTGVEWHDFAFFPAWPGVIRLGSTLLGPIGLHQRSVAFLLANGLFVVAAILIWRVLADRFGGRTATAGTALLAFAPPAYVFSLAYSESLFVLLAALSFAVSRSLWRGPIGFAASLTRIAGLAIVASATVMAFRTHGPRRRGALAASVGGLLGFAAWWAFIAVLTGSPTGFMSGSPEWVPNPGLGQLPRVFLEPSIQQTGWLAYMVVVAISALLLVRRELELGLFVLATLAMCLLPGSAMHSMPRYLLAAFPLFAGIGDRLTSRKALVAVLVAFALGQALFALWTVPSHRTAP